VRTAGVVVIVVVVVVWFCQRQHYHQRQQHAFQAAAFSTVQPNPQPPTHHPTHRAPTHEQVRQKFMELFQREPGGYPDAFPHRQRVLLLYQRVDGVDVCLFCMYVQEYGPDCPAPNRWVDVCLRNQGGLCFALFSWGVGVGVCRIGPSFGPVHPPTGHRSSSLHPSTHPSTRPQQRRVPLLPGQHQVLPAGSQRGGGERGDEPAHLCQCSSNGVGAVACTARQQPNSRDPCNAFVPLLWLVLLWLTTD